VKNKTKISHCQNSSKI